MKREGHPRLRGESSSWERNRCSGFSSSEMRSLTSICEAFFPPLDDCEDCDGDHEPMMMNKKAIPELIARATRKKALPEAVLVVRAVLWMLSTRIGTAVVCGSLSIDSKWPFVNNFSQLSPQRRERALRNWSSSIFSPLRLLFHLLKSLCLYFFFARVSYLYFFLLFYCIFPTNTTYS